jgi:hypothetical protein
VASTIQVEPDSLTTDALDLADSQVPIVPAMAMAPAADPVSQDVAAVLEAHSGALTTVLDHSGALRAHGGAVLAQTAANLQATDQDNAATVAAVAGGSRRPCRQLSSGRSPACRQYLPTGSAVQC